MHKKSQCFKCRRFIIQIAAYILSYLSNILSYFLILKPFKCDKTITGLVFAESLLMVQNRRNVAGYKDIALISMYLALPYLENLCVCCLALLVVYVVSPARSFINISIDWVSSIFYSNYSDLILIKNIM